jgi:hypothetical protein
MRDSVCFGKNRPMLEVGEKYRPGEYWACPCESCRSSVAWRLQDGEIQPRGSQEVKPQEKGNEDINLTDQVVLARIVISHNDERGYTYRSIREGVLDEAWDSLFEVLGAEFERITKQLTEEES